MSGIKVEPFACEADLRLDSVAGSHKLVAAVWLQVSRADVEMDPIPEVQVLFDTGSVLTILSRDWAVAAQLFPLLESPTEPLLSRHGELFGVMVPVRFTIPHRAGEPMIWEGEAWVSESWPGPTVIGWRGALDKLRFHLDPGTSTAHFDLL